MALEWVGRAENLAISGPSGTGKTHVCEALGAAVIEKGMRVAWFTLESLTATAGRAKIDASVQKVVARICCDCTPDRGAFKTPSRQVQARFSNLKEGGWRRERDLHPFDSQVRIGAHMMLAESLPNGNLLVPRRAEGPDGIVGDGWVEIGPDDPEFEAWFRWIDDRKPA